MWLPKHSTSTFWGCKLNCIIQNLQISTSTVSPFLLKTLSSTCAALCELQTSSKGIKSPLLCHKLIIWPLFSVETAALNVHWDMYTMKTVCSNSNRPWQKFLCTKNQLPNGTCKASVHKAMPLLFLHYFVFHTLLKQYYVILYYIASQQCTALSLLLRIGTGS